MPSRIMSLLLKHRDTYYPKENIPMPHDPNKPKPEDEKEEEEKKQEEEKKKHQPVPPGTSGGQVPGSGTPSGGYTPQR